MWKQLRKEQIQKRISGALEQNRNYYDPPIMGAPVSRISEILPDLMGGIDENTSFMQAWFDNPNHIGCHTFGKSNQYFAGTQALEKEVIDICAKDIFRGEGEYDGYVTSGGTESIIMAIWAYRNLFMRAYNAAQHEIAIITSADSHYAAYKASDLLSIDIVKSFYRVFKGCQLPHC